jgi:hypothetical protein
MTNSMKQWIVPIVLAGAVLLVGSNASTSAHHGGFVNWQQENLIGPLTFVATSFAFRFPHPQISGEIRDQSGNVEPWVIALRPTPTGLRNRGWTRASIKPGDTLALTYSPHVTAENVGVARRIVVNGEFLPIEPGDEECRTTTTPYRRCADVQ